MYPPGRRMRAPGGAGLRALPDPAEPEPGACREPGSRPRGIGGRPADRSSSFGRRFHGQGPWSAAGASGIRCEDATVGVVIPRFRCAKSPASMPDALTGGQRACSTYGDRVRPEPNPVMRIVSIAVLGTVTGALASLAAILFVKLVVALNDWLLISARSRIMADDAHWVMLATLCVPAVGGLVVGLMLRHIPERRPHGPPDVIRVVQGPEGRIAPRSGLLSALASLVSLGAGASVGQYGPLVHLGATLGSLVSRIGRHGRWMATVGVGCGVASAISTAFTAPVAGIIFAHEVILRHYSLRAFAPITVASTVGYVIATVGFDRRPLFRVEGASVAYAPEFLGFILIGVAGALVAVVYMRAILLAGRVAGKLTVPGHLKPMLAGAVLGAVAIWIPRRPRHRQGDAAFRDHRPGVRARRAGAPARGQDCGHRPVHRVRVRGRGVQPRPARRHPVRGAGRQRRRAAAGRSAIGHRNLCGLRHGGGDQRGDRSAADHDPDRVRAHPQL